MESFKKRVLNVKSSLLVIIIFLFVFSGCITQNSQKSMTDTPLRETNESILPMRNLLKPIDAVLLIDQSGSMNGYGSIPPTDPKQLRVSSAQYFINNLAAKSNENLQHQIGIVNFGSQAPGELSIPLTPIHINDESKINAIQQKITKLDLMHTNFLNAFGRVNELFKESRHDGLKAKKTMIVFTDGKPDDGSNKSVDTYFSELQNYIKETFSKDDLEIFIIGINTNPNEWQLTLPYWKKIIPESNIFTIADMSQLKHIYNDIIRKLLNIPKVEPEYIDNSPKSFLVQPYIDSVEFHVFFDGQTNKLLIQDPTGKAITVENSKDFKEINKGDYSIFILQNPLIGKWIYQLEKPGSKILVYKNFIPGDFHLIEPMNTHPIGKESDIMFRFLKKDGTPIQALREIPLRIGLTLISPGNKEIFRTLMNDEGNGYYSCKQIFHPKELGNYRLLVEVTSGEGYDLQLTKEVKVIEHPYILFEKPSSNNLVLSSNSMDLKASIMLNDKKLPVVDFFKNHPDLLLRVQVQKFDDAHEKYEANNENYLQHKAYWLDYSNDGNLYSATLTLPLLKEKDLLYLVAELKGEDKANRTYQEQSTLLISTSHHPAVVLFDKIKRGSLYYFPFWLLQIFLILAWINKRKKINTTIFIKEEDRKKGKTSIKSKKQKPKKKNKVDIFDFDANNNTVSEFEIDEPAKDILSGSSANLSNEQAIPIQYKSFIKLSLPKVKRRVYIAGYSDSKSNMGYKVMLIRSLPFVIVFFAPILFLCSSKHNMSSSQSITINPYNIRIE